MTKVLHGDEFIISGSENGHVSYVKVYTISHKWLLYQNAVNTL